MRTGTLIQELCELEEMVRSGLGLKLGDGFTHIGQVERIRPERTSAEKSVEYSPSSLCQEPPTEADWERFLSDKPEKDLDDLAAEEHYEDLCTEPGESSQK